MKKGLLTGLLLFGIFFGAGNLIFPPALGVNSGENFWPAILGFVVSGVGIAIVTLIVGTLNPKGYGAELDEKISPLYSTTYLVLLYLSIGPLFAIPRTAATSFDIGVAPLVKGSSLPWLLIFTVIYFACAFILAINPSKILDRVGKILTPIFALLIVILVILGVSKFDATNTAAKTYATSSVAFGTGFIEGYNTLDALASVAFSVVVVQTLKQLGFRNKREYVSTVWLVSLVVALGFSLLYIGLAYLGNHFPVPAEVMVSDVNKGVYILSQATQAIFGANAQIFLAVMVTMTCFTTTAGLIVAVSEFFRERFPQLGYKTYATLFTLIGFGIANLGLGAIIQYSIPVLLVLYPVTIVIVLLIIVNKFVALSKIGMQLTIALVTAISLAGVIAEQCQLTWLTDLIHHLPFASYSLYWLTPALVGIGLSLVLPQRQRSETFEME